MLSLFITIYNVIFSQLDISEITAEEDASFFAAIVTKNIHLVKTDIDMDIIFNTIGTLMNYANNHNQVYYNLVQQMYRIVY